MHSLRQTMNLAVLCVSGWSSLPSAQLLTSYLVSTFCRFHDAIRMGLSRFLLGGTRTSYYATPYPNIYRKTIALLLPMLASPQASVLTPLHASLENAVRVTFDERLTGDDSKRDGLS